MANASKRTRSLLELSETLVRCDGLDTFWRKSVAALSTYGIEGVFFGTVASRLELDPHHLTGSVFWRSTYPNAYFDAFGYESFLDDEITASRCIEGSDIVIWHQNELWDCTPSQRRRAAIERDLGLDVGVSVPASHFSPNHLGGFGVATPHFSPRQFEAFWSEKGTDVLTVLGMIDTGLRGPHLPELVGLSKRETETLTWLACGSRPDEIADRLGIGYRSIDKYVNSARRKLKASTRDQAVAKALIFNLIRP